MSWSSLVRTLFQPAAKKKIQPRKRPTLSLERLEDRLLLYSVTGNAWPNPHEITISFMPDNTPLSSAVGSTLTSNLFSTFNAKFGSTAAWENQILKAAQVWAQQTNINFVVVPDNGAPSGSGAFEQGNPGFGDIRIGGYAFGNSTLAVANQPPPINNYSIAGDIAFNTGQTWNVGSTYDLFTVAAHEMGHALGMDHSSAGTTSIMYPSYTGVKSGLSSDDVAGIRNIYSGNNARTSDAYDAAASNGTVATATNIGSLINSTTLTALVANLDVTTTSDLDYYTFTAPSGTSGSLTVQVQSQGLSLLSPKVTVYAANGATVLGSASGLNQYGTTLDVTVAGVVAGQQYYVQVQGADSTAFSTGAYALGLNFNSAPTPIVCDIPNTGVWRYQDATGWQQLTTFDASQVAANARGDAAINIPNNGVWRYQDGKGWLQLTTFDATQVAMNANGDVAIEIPNNGVWRYQDGKGWLQLTPSNATQVAINANGEVAINIPNNGVWRYQDGKGWQQLTAFDATQVAMNANGDVAIEIPNNGVWRYQDATGWLQLTPSNATQVAMNASGEVAINIPNNGVWRYQDGKGWLQLNAVDASQVAMNANGDVVVELPNNGVWRYQDGKGWQLINTANASLVAVGSWAASTAPLIAPSLNVQVPNGLILSAGGGVADGSANGDALLSSVPTITGVTPDNGTSTNDGITNTPNITFTGSAPEGNLVQLYLLNNNQQLYVGSAQVTDHEQWSWTYTGAPLSPGAYSFGAIAVDNLSGIISNMSAPLPVVIDPSVPNAPTVSVNNPVGGAPIVFSNVTTPVVAGTAAANTAISVFVDGKLVVPTKQALYSTMSDSSGAWSFTLPGALPAGVHTVTATVMTVAGTTGPASAAYQFMITSAALNAPLITGAAPAVGVNSNVFSNAVNKSQIKIAGVANAGATVNLFQSSGGKNTAPIGSVVADATGHWVFDYSHTTLLTGTYSFTATETTSTGTSPATQPFAVTIDLTIPNTPVITGLAAAGQQNPNLPPLSASHVLVGTADANDTVYVYLNSKQVGTAMGAPNGGWSFDFGSLPLQAGANMFTVQAVAAAGNRSAVSQSFSVTGYTAPASPVVTGFSPAYSGCAAGLATALIPGNVAASFTNSETPTIFGTAPARSYVGVFQNGVYVGYAAANANGAWSYLTQGLDDGIYNFTAVDLVASGMSSAISNGVTLIVKTEQPNAPVISGVSPDTGVVGDQITNSQKIVLNGKADPGSTVNLYQQNSGSNGTLIGSTTAKGSGAWSFDDSATTLAAGQYNFTATETDQAGNTGKASQAFTVTIDLTTPNTPVITGLAAASGKQDHNLPPVSVAHVVVGTADANDVVNVYLNGAQIGTTTAAPQGNWSFDFGSVSLQTGANTFTVQAAEAAGNLSLVSSKFVVSANQAPTAAHIQGFLPAYGLVNTGYTNSPTPTLYGSASAGNYVEVYQNATYVGYTTAAVNGSWSYTTQHLQDGAYSFTAVTLNSNGLAGSASTACNLTVKTTVPNAPVILGITPDNGVAADGVTNSPNIQILGTGIANTTVQMFNNGVSIGTTNVNSNGSWQFDYSKTTLAAGAYNFTAQAVDLAGNVSSLSRSYAVTIDLAIPTTPVIAGIASNTGGNGAQTLTISGTAAANNQVAVSLAGAALGNANADGQGRWSFNYSSAQFANGSYLFTATVGDVAGNLSSPSTPFKLLLGNGMQTLSAPQLTAASILKGGPGGNQNAVAAPTFTGNALAGTLVTIVNGNNVLGTAVADSTGRWSFTSSTLAKGPQNIFVFATDSQGDEGLFSNPLTFKI